MTDNTSDLEILLKAVTDPDKTIPYHPIFKKMTGNLHAAILLQQILFRWKTQGYKEFYKFKEPCNHNLYKKGDSWIEELGFTRREFDTALKKIGYKIKLNTPQEEKEDYYVWYRVDSNRKTWYSVNEAKIAIGAFALYVTAGLHFTYRRICTLRIGAFALYYNTENTAENTTEITTDTVEENFSVKETNGKGKSVSDIKPVVNNFGNGRNTSFILNNSNKKTDFCCQRFLLLLEKRSNDIPAGYKKLHIGDINKFKDKVNRFGRKIDKGEIPGAIELFDKLPDDNVHKIEISEYVKHEAKKWDFSKTKDKDTVLGQFVLEYLLWAPNYAHFKLVKENNLLSEDISLFNKRNKKKGKQLSKEDEIYGETFEEYAMSNFAN